MICIKMTTIKITVMKATERTISIFHVEWEKNTIYFTVFYDYKMWRGKKRPGSEHSNRT